MDVRFTKKGESVGLGNRLVCRVVCVHDVIGRPSLHGHSCLEGEMMSLVGNILNLREAHGTSGQILQESAQACGPRFRRAL